MSYVPIAAAAAAANSETSRANDLAAHLQSTIDEYRRQNPKTKDLDVRMALQTSLRRNRCKLDGTDHRPLLLVFAGVILLLLLGVASFVFVTNRGY